MNLKRCEDNKYRYGVCRGCLYYGLCTSVEHVRISVEMAEQEGQKAA